MDVRQTIVEWAVNASAGDRMVIVAEADGRGRAVWGSSVVTAGIIAEGPEQWLLCAADGCEQTLQALKEFPPAPPPWT